MPRRAIVTHLRKIAGLSQGELADAAGVARRTIIRVERGDSVSLETLAALARPLGVNLLSLVGSEVLADEFGPDDVVQMFDEVVASLRPAFEGLDGADADELLANAALTHLVLHFADRLMLINDEAPGANPGLANRNSAVGQDRRRVPA